MSQHPAERDSVAVFIVYYNGQEYIAPCLDSLRQSDFTGIDCTVWILDNASPDGSGQALVDTYGQQPQREYPFSLRIERSPANLGFAGANNRLWELASAGSPDLDFVFLLNQDTEVDSQFLERSIAYIRSHPQAGCVQSLLLLDPERDRINTAGNDSHFLGFGLPTHYRDFLADEPQRFDGEIGYPSGAAVLIESKFIRSLGLFQPEMFMYLEDADLGWKLRQVRHPPHICGQSLVYHKYAFNEGLAFYEHLERNRLWLLLVYYRWATLVLMFPAILFMEVGQLVFAGSRGLLRPKLRSYAYFLNGDNVRRLWSLRRQALIRRQVSDREFLGGMSGRIDSPHLRSPLLRYVANPVLDLYLKILRWIVWW